MLGGSCVGLVIEMIVLICGSGEVRACAGRELRWLGD